MVPRRLIKALLLVVAAAVVPVHARAAGEQEQLQKYITDLKAADKDDVFADNPEADALRKQIFELVRRMEPKPAVPDEYDNLVGQGTYEFKNAKGIADFMMAASSYNSASLVAPWLPEVYFNMGVALEKSRQYDAAIRKFNLYLAAAPDANDARDVRQRIGGLRVASRDADRVAAEEYIEKLRPLLFGNYVAYYCRVPSHPDDGCSVAETATTRWTNSGLQTSIAIEGDEIVVRGNGQVWYRGHAACFAGTFCAVSWKNADGKDVWGQVGTDGICGGKPYAHIHISLDRPTAIGAGNDSAHYHYFDFDKPSDWCS